VNTAARYLANRNPKPLSLNTNPRRFISNLDAAADDAAPVSITIRRTRYAVALRQNAQGALGRRALTLSDLRQAVPPLQLVLTSSVRTPCSNTDSLHYMIHAAQAQPSVGEDTIVAGAARSAALP
jgi:hypothetical protein